MPSVQFNLSISGLGETIAHNLQRSNDGGTCREVTIPKGYAGTVTTRTDANTGTVTLANGHAITTGMKVDLYFIGNDGLQKVQYNVTVGTVSGNSMPFDLGVGDDLRTGGTGWAVVVAPRVQINCPIDGDNLTLLAVKPHFADSSLEAPAHIDFQDVDNDEIAELNLNANRAQVFDIAGGAANPFTGDPITKAYASNGSTQSDGKLRMAWLEDTTP